MSYVKLAAVAAIIVGVLSATYIVYRHGQDAERQRVERENTDAAGHANEAAMSWRDCMYRNGVYHFDTGKCVWTSTGNR